MLQELELRHVGPAPTLALTLAQRMNLITGDNGLGKTFLLDVAWWALTRNWPGLPAVPQRRAPADAEISYKLRAKSTDVAFTSKYDYTDQTWALRPGRPPAPGMVLYARVDGSFSVWDPARNYYRNAPSRNVDAPERPPAYHFTPSQVRNGLEGPQGKPICNGLIRDWATWQAKNSEPFHQLTRALSALSPAPGEQLAPGELTRVSLDDVRDIPTIKTAYGEEVPFVYASAGVQRIVTLAYLLVWTWQEHLLASNIINQDVTRQIIFLIDEIEAHLHPRWQRTILRALLAVVVALTGSDDVKVQLLAVTHSPLVLASLEPLFDPAQDALWHYQLVNGAVALVKEEWRRRGDANTWLVSDVFAFQEPRALEAEQAILAAHGLMRRQDVSAQEFEKVRHQLRCTLPDIDPFWLTFRAWARQAGLMS